MDYGDLISNNLIDIYNHKVFNYDGIEVNPSSTSKCWNNKVDYFNRNIVILAKGV